MKQSHGGRVVACIPYYRCDRFIRRAVRGLLEQTYRNITVVVLNDADFITPPWPVLEDVLDPRLLRIDLTSNRGPFFATQVLLAATTAPYFLIQDSDDWSHPERVERLVATMEQKNAGYAVSAQAMYYPDSSGVYRLTETRWSRNIRDENAAVSAQENPKYQIDTELGPDFKYTIPHHGLYRTSALRSIGGYNPACRINYDIVVPKLLLMAGKLAHVRLPLYSRPVRTGSITNSSTTGFHSSQGRRERAKAEAVYTQCYQQYMEFKQHKISNHQLVAAIRETCLQHGNREVTEALKMEINRLRSAYEMV